MAESSIVPDGDGANPQASDEELIESLRDTLGVRPSKPSDSGFAPSTRADDHAGGADAASSAAPSQRQAYEAFVSGAALAVADEILAAADSTAQNPPSSRSGPAGRA